MERSQTSADLLVGTPPHILREASDLTTVCHDMAVLSPEINSVVQSLFEAIISHEEKQQEFLMGRHSLREFVTAMNSKARTSTAAGIIVQLYMHPEYSERQAHCIAILENLILEAESILARFQVLQGCIDVPSTSNLRKFFAQQHATYHAFRDKYLRNANHNSCRWKDAPGAEFGMKPFEDIMFAWDGTIMVWDEEFGDWGWLEHYHPCRYMPGSDWGKFYHDLTHGDFWLRDRRPIVDWVHAAPAKALLGHLQADHRRAIATQSGENIPSIATPTNITKNVRLAASTGIPYPVCDNENLQATSFEIDLGEVTTSQFVPPPGDMPRLDELSNKVREVITGKVPEVPAVQEHEEMIYRLGQE